MRGNVEFEYRDKPVYEAIIRFVNTAVAALGLICLAPLMLVIALILKVSNPQAPIFYRGQRIGRAGRPFSIQKFRTMTPGAEQQIGARLVDRGSQYITPLGRLLRRHKLDELPQLLNVLRGDMNFVGPRPVRELFVKELRQRIPEYDRRFLVRPGITGLAQVNGGYYTDPRNKLRYEQLYITHRSVWLDLKLVVATLFIIVSRALTMLSLLFLLLAFVAFVPTTFLPRLHIALFGLPVNAAFLLIVCLVSGWFISGLLQRGFRLKRTLADRYIVCFILWAVLGAILNPGVGDSLLGVLYFCSGAFALYFLAIQTIGHDVRKIRLCFASLGLVTIIESVWGILEYVIRTSTSCAEEIRVVSLMGDPNVLALYLAMTLPILYYLCQSSNGWPTRFFWGGGAFLAGTCLMLTFSRSGYIAFSVVILTFLFRWHRQLFYGALALCALFVVQAELTGNTRFSPSQLLTSPSQLSMIRLYDSVLSDSQEKLLVGVGWRNWRTSLAHTVPSQDVIQMGAISLPRTLKNMYLIILVEYGLIGLFLLLLIFVTILETIYHGSYQVADPSLQVLLWAILSGTLGFMANMFFFDSLYFIAVQATLWLLLGVGVGIALDFAPMPQRWYRVRQFHD